MKSLTASQLRGAVDHVSSLTCYQKAAKSLGDSFRKSGGYHQAADEIFAFKIRYQI